MHRAGFYYQRALGVSLSEGLKLFLWMGEGFSQTKADFQVQDFCALVFPQGPGEMFC